MVRRSSLSNISVSLQQKIYNIVGKSADKEAVMNPGEAQSKPSCGFCPCRKNRFTNNKCSRCQTPLCREHTDMLLSVHHGQKLKPKSRVRKWKNTSPNEIRTFIGLAVLQSVCSKPSFDMYFSARESIETPFFVKTMREYRFRLIHKFIHFADNNFLDNDPHVRKLYKIKPIIDHLQNKFRSVYIPGKNISVDESLMGWKGRLSWKQYIPSKRKRFGIKFYMLCESSTGYVYNFFVYTGADTNYGHKYIEQPIAARIVLSLCDSLLNKGHCLLTCMCVCKQTEQFNCTVFTEQFKLSVETVREWPT
ncbi:unnamed protein product [Acanthoscelides obtectus]|uniref:PiggyBac transposable element-derived protein domain-containing protein n=1 Tax=Acanthoscelides obtectus TaxID=200917 RepID=A0A9P0JP17_ACAOB|nr:unnamed protein product [Acanthoscelides obtectus]CAK1642923.1 PiggyBac transposable element-derived protein 4 [Acanthoscelides obtectus]